MAERERDIIKKELKVLDKVEKGRNIPKNVFDASVEAKPPPERLTHEEIYKLAKEKTLEIFHVGSDKINYKILEMLPTDINHVMTELNLTKMPVYARINSLEDAGLLEKCTGKIRQTELAEDFIESMRTIKNKVDKAIKSNSMELNWVVKPNKDTKTPRKK